MGKQPIKNNLIMILEVLKKHSDANHRLTQKQVQELLKIDFGIACDRKAVKRNLMNLVEFGFDIEYDEIKRITTVTDENGNKKKIVTYIITDIYYNHVLEESEVRLISDGLLFSRYITAKETKALIEKIEQHASPFAVNNLKNAVNFEALGHTENAQVFYTVELLNQAIEEKKQVAFCYCEYGTDKKLHSRREEKYIVNPYYTVTANGRYYLICNVDKYDNIANFRMDKIRDIELLDTSAKSVRKTEGYANGFNLSAYMKDHIYMFGGDTVKAKLEIDSFLIGQVIDWFGKNFKVVSQSDDSCEIALEVNENALFYWAMQYGQFVKVLAPQSVVERVRGVAEDIVKKYKEE